MRRVLTHNSFVIVSIVASLVSSWIPIPLISSLHVVNYIDVGRLEMEMQTKVPQSDKLITLKMPYMDIIKSLIADQESQVTLVYPLYQLISNQDLSDIISKDVHIPTNAKTGQSFRVKIAFDSISGKPSVAKFTQIVRFF